jgi:hypothetical protein
MARPLGRQARWVDEPLSERPSCNPWRTVAPAEDESSMVSAVSGLVTRSQVVAQSWSDMARTSHAQLTDREGKARVKLLRLVVAVVSMTPAKLRSAPRKGSCFRHQEPH